MTILSSLARAYDRLPDAPKPGLSLQKIGLVVGLNPDGTIASVTDWRDGEGKKRQPRPMPVPQPVKRASNILPNSFWDKTAYSLGVKVDPGPRTALEHRAFVDHHRALLAGTEDEGLLAFLRFLEFWRPEMFEAAGFTEDMKDQNVVFALESERRRNVFLFDRLAARALIEAPPDRKAETALCLVTGRRGPIARLHPSIKGVWGGQSAGASIVSFNLDAFESYGHVQGDNAPVSQAAASAYVGALNHFLTKDSGHRIQIGDASTVFWAEAADAQAAAMSESVFAAMFADEPIDTTGDTRRVGDILERIRKRLPLHEVAPELCAGVRFHILGLAPNAARISVRFWLEDEFGAIVSHYARLWQEMRVEPADPGGAPPLWQYLAETAARGKSDNVPPNLAGEWMRAILAGSRYPMTLLSTLLMRIRADGHVTSRRVSMLKALVIRNYHLEKEAPVALDPENPNRGYLLGRLFAAYEFAQTGALGRNVNATIKDKFYGSASVQPQKVFRMLDAGSVNHLAKIGKERPGQRVNIEKAIAAIMDRMDPNDDPFPPTLSAAEQALFGLGYYHQRSAFLARKEAPTEEPAAS
ncbi:type I-C CRISPR-associated protein Cas8c/Csd1 [Aureimonas sp. Leaf454]|uniref:type I-C CRISPR-associated protein Cas8c/Csd1 n=1 Tax=Aureimonas sp. Leaf454 TaxID=1736381 RepID=UPI0006F7C1E0|nr:type I-C CRISPR-associated protein Cas8c/Csd1 [Aureimonas sp. Leaf454]KQT50832.1 type I-C CRISPR-associated protein Cas8c/Csd1 [Aureimonas sp. Leaf454]